MKILVIEDEPEMLQLITDSLEENDFTVESATNYESAVVKVGVYDYDLIILDITLPDGNGLSLLKKIKEENRQDGILIVSAKDSLDDKLQGLGLGADDYLTKPFYMAELNARVNSILRRRKFEGNIRINYGNVEIWPEEHIINVGLERLELHKKEYEILLYLVVNKNKLVTKTALAEHVWGDSIDKVDNFEFIYSQIKNLRKKLRDRSASVDIQAVYGIGYKLTSF